jgi:hypothetical protein
MSTATLPAARDLFIPVVLLLLIGILIFTLAGRYPKMENKSRKSGQMADVFHLNPYR